MKKIKKLLALVLLLVVLIGFLYGISISEASSHREEASRIQESVEKAAVQCYAMHGIYPKTLEELLAQYTLHLNQKDYRIFYDYNGGNIMPSIYVIERE
ncbi:hypothetical protein GSF08_11435 [Clostridiaceae bacterium DONG20-135]|uniref:Uncharacterized protein n=1 Tax=Copranaerobaculum intestinale TaxID=2692629 RepID=A0A6N8U8K8_9FIRM|nr:hypothetical protein [Copranaerobaculum intestinale]MXQ74538.1 hypothetical protein [Copranaerobaculum intestinale]